MGKQYDKVEKKRRRQAYIERKKIKAKEAAVAANKPRVRKPAAKKAAPAPAPAPAAAPAETAAAE